MKKTRYLVRLYQNSKKNQMSSKPQKKALLNTDSRLSQLAFETSQHITMLFMAVVYLFPFAATN